MSNILHIFDKSFGRSPAICQKSSYLIKKSQSEHLCDLNRRVATQVVSDSQIENQNELVEYLVNMASDASVDKNFVTLFQKGFHKLSFDKQEEFFQQAFDENLMKDLWTKDILPTDIKELNFTLGESEFTSRPKFDELALVVSAQFSKFKELNRVHLNLQSLEFYGPVADAQLDDLNCETYLKNATQFKFSSTKKICVKPGYYYMDRGSPITNMVVELRKWIDHAKEEKRSFDYKIAFMNLEIDKTGEKICEREDSSAFTIKPFSSKLVRFLEGKPLYPAAEKKK